jgi:hypothetical protein
MNSYLQAKDDRKIDISYPQIRIEYPIRLLSCQTFKTLFLSSKTLAVRDSVKKFRCKTA